MIDVDMRHIQYQGETLPPFPFPLVLAFHLVLGKFHIYSNMLRLYKRCSHLGRGHPQGRRLDVYEYYFTNVPVLGYGAWTTLLGFFFFETHF